MRPDPLPEREPTELIGFDNVQRKLEIATFTDSVETGFLFENGELTYVADEFTAVEMSEIEATFAHILMNSADTPITYKDLEKRLKKKFPNEKIDVASFLPAEFLGGLEKSLAEEKMMGRINHEYPHIKREEVLCIPLYSILKAIDMTHIHFFSLDVEGAEMDILRTIPFNLVTIELFLIEYYVPYDVTETQKRLKEFRDFFDNLGTYKEVHLGSVDVAFARK